MFVTDKEHGQKVSLLLVFGGVTLNHLFKSCFFQPGCGIGSSVHLIRCIIWVVGGAWRLCLVVGCCFEKA